MGERLTVDLSFIQHNREQKPMEPTLGESLGGKKLTPAEQRAAQAIDVLNISLRDKQVLFAAQLFFGPGGALRARDQLGFSINKLVNARNQVRTDDRYEDLWNKLGFLMQTNVLEVATGILNSLKHTQIAEKLGIKKTQVDAISAALIAKKIIKQSLSGRHNSRMFAEFVGRVEKEDDPNISDKELAQKLGESETRIKRARKRLRIQGKIKNRTASNIAQSQRKSKALLPLREQVRLLDEKGHTAAEIAQITGATPQQVKHQRALLRRAPDR